LGAPRCGRYRRHPRPLLQSVLCKLLCGSMLWG